MKQELFLRVIKVTGLEIKYFKDNCHGIYQVVAFWEGAGTVLMRN